jgi:hypothetical protein
MKYSIAAAGLLAMSVAAVEFTNNAYDVQQGQPIVLKWDQASGPVTITLKNGPNSNLGTVTTIDCKSRHPLTTFSPISLMAIVSVRLGQQLQLDAST